MTVKVKNTEYKVLSMTIVMSEIDIINPSTMGLGGQTVRHRNDHITGYAPYYLILEKFIGVTNMK